MRQQTHQIENKESPLIDQNHLSVNYVPICSNQGLEVKSLVDHRSVAKILMKKLFILHEESSFKSSDESMSIISSVDALA